MSHTRYLLHRIFENLSWVGKAKKVKKMKADYGVDINELSSKSSDAVRFFAVTGSADKVEQCVQHIEEVIGKVDPNAEIRVSRPGDDEAPEPEPETEEPGAIEQDTEEQPPDNTELEEAEEKLEEAEPPVLVEPEEVGTATTLASTNAQVEECETFESNAQVLTESGLASNPPAEESEEAPADGALIVEDESALRISTEPDPDALPQPPPPTSVAASARNREVFAPGEVEELLDSPTRKSPKKEPQSEVPPPDMDAVIVESASRTVDESERFSANIEPESTENVIDQYFTEELDSKTATTVETVSANAVLMAPEQPVHSNGVDSRVPPSSDPEPVNMDDALEKQEELDIELTKTQAKSEAQKTSVPVVERRGASLEEDGGAGWIPYAAVAAICVCAGVYYFRLQSKQKGKN